MDQVTQAKTLFRIEQWKKITADCQDSGLPVKTWCNQNDFKEQSYYYYLKKIREIAKKNTQTTIYRFPIYEQQAAAGTGIFGYDKNYEIEDIIADEIPHDAKFAIKIKGESMSPDIPNGCIVLVNPNVQEHMLNHANVVANFNGEIICKQYNKELDHIWFASLNRPDYNNDDRYTYSSDEYKIIGKVVKVIK